jgi:beta-mannosidase
VHASPSVATDLGVVAWPVTLSPVHFVQLELRDGSGKLLSDNFYWRALPQQQDDLQALNQLAPITLDAKAVRADANGKVLLTITLHNPGRQVALMAHLQLRRKNTGDRVLPVFYSDNYVSLVPNGTRTITVEAAEADLKGDIPLVVVDGWNIEGASFSGPDVAIAPNWNAQVAHWPATGLPMANAPAAQ